MNESIIGHKSDDASFLCCEGKSELILLVSVKQTKSLDCAEFNRLPTYIYDIYIVSPTCSVTLLLCLK